MCVEVIRFSSQWAWSAIHAMAASALPGVRHNDHVMALTKGHSRGRDPSSACGAGGGAAGNANPPSSGEAGSASPPCTVRLGDTQHDRYPAGPVGEIVNRLWQSLGKFALEFFQPYSARCSSCGVIGSGWFTTVPVTLVAGIQMTAPRA